MKFILKTSTVIILTFILQFPTSAQSKYYTKSVSDTLAINFNNQYKISALSIIPFSETIYLNNKLIDKSDYTISYAKGEFTLSKEINPASFDTLVINYRTIKLSLKKEYKKRSLVYKYDEANRDTIRIVEKDGGGLSSESIFGSNLQRSGTLVRGFTVGTNKDFSLNSGFRLQLSGNLTDDIELVAALTDENTPIQPEGNTEKLDELDKVFIQLKHSNAQGTFGDYQLQKRYGEFGVIDRKLQGLVGEYYSGNDSAYFSLASSRGKFNTNKFQGQDGVQGPYRLSGINNEPDIIVIAGTEKVYVDGVEMKRGERNDYVIEYSNAEITFTPNRLITSASRISVDFEYTDRRYARTFLGAGTQVRLFNDKLGIKFQYLREGDDLNSPIDIALSDSDKAILRNAGDDRNKATRSGATLAVPDSLGEIHGIYSKIDTIINNQPYTYYRYNPGDTTAKYNVSFSFVGTDKGDYTRESLGNYRWVGISQGSYSPIVFLPMPELKQFGNILFDYSPVDDIKISFEFAGSLWDKNRFSEYDQNDNFGAAANFFLDIKPQNISLGNFNFGKAGLSYKDRFIQSRFTSLDRFNQVEFNRYYNISDIQQKVDEHLRELNINYLPIEQINITSSFGFLKRGEEFNSIRYNNTLNVTDNKKYNFFYNFDYVDSKNFSLSSKWLRQTASGYYTVGYIKPGFEFLAENKEDKNQSADSLLAGSLKYFEVSPYINLIGLTGFKVSIKYTLRNDYLPLNGIMLKQAQSTTQSYEVTYDNIKEINSTLTITLRDKKFTEAFKQQGFLDNQTILIRSRTNLRLWEPVLNGNVYYEVSTQKTAKLQKVFIRVEKGTGNYKYLGDLNNNGISDVNEFEPTIYDGDYIQITVPTEELFPVINLKASTNWRIKFGDIFEKSSSLYDIFSPLSSETFWRVEEISREEDYKKIYLLQFSDFQNPDKTISGTNSIQQDFFIFENRQDFSLRLRFSQTRGLNQYNDGPVFTYNRERSIRLKIRLLPEISNQTEFINKNDNLSTSQLTVSNRARLITSNSINTDFSYRPENNVEVGFAFKVGRSTDDYPDRPSVIDFNVETIRMNLSFAGSGRLRIELERNELNGNSEGNYLPFELTQGNIIGKNYYWRLNFDYRISSNLQSTLSYDGRWQGAGKVIHTARAEFRAYF
ncbi:MAG TPA: hypothetical protein VKA26_09990 [Ignavibacteriaceae bacterium]|nr:hypothetical protein [Ignavibacteriaceae bacterium]